MQKEGDFKIINGIDGIKVFLFDTSRIQESCDFILKNNLKIVSTYSEFYNAPDLSPILGVKHQVEGIQLKSGIDYSDLKLFTNLTSLSFDEGKCNLDFNNFPKLETLQCDMTNQLDLSPCKKLKNISLSNLKTKDLSSLSISDTIEYMAIFQSNITSLSGIEKYPNLNNLLFYGLRHLTTIRGLEKLPNLNEIEIDHCKKIEDYELLGNVESLKKIIISESGSMKSLEFVKKLPNLKFISFRGTDILDGDITHCRNINYVGFDNKRHYNLKMKDFKKK